MKLTRKWDRGGGHAKIRNVMCNTVVIRGGGGGGVTGVPRNGKFLTFKKDKKRGRLRRTILTEFDQKVFGGGDDIVEIVFGQHQDALVRLDGHLFLETGVGDGRVHQE